MNETSVKMEDVLRCGGLFSITVLTDDMAQKLDDGRAKGMTRHDVVERSRAKPCANILPCRFGDGTGVVRLWFLPFVRGFKETFARLEQNGWLNSDDLHDQEILLRLENICDGSDDQWAILTAEFTEQGELWLWIGHLDVSAAEVECRNCLKLDIGKMGGLSVQFRQSVARDVAPYAKSLVKISDVKAGAKAEWIVDYWRCGCGHELYRINPMIPTEQTVEYYPDGVDLLVENL